MTAEEFKTLLTDSIGWTHQLSIDECDKTEDHDEENFMYEVSLKLWGISTVDYFICSQGRWYAEGGDGIIVDTPLTVWQWIACNFADQLGGNVE